MTTENTELPFEYTDIDGDCPNPEEVIKQHTKDLANRFKAYVCGQLALGKAYHETQFAELKTTLDNLDSERVLERMARFTEFMNSVDADGDNVIDLLATFQEEYAALRQYAEVTRGRTDTNANDIKQLLQQLTSYTNTTNEALSNLNRKDSEQDLAIGSLRDDLTESNEEISRVDGVVRETKGTADNNSQLIGSLRTDVEELKKLDLDRINELTKNSVCGIWRKARSGFVASILEVDEIFGIDCGIYPNPGQDLPADPNPVSEEPSTPPVANESDDQADGPPVANESDDQADTPPAR